MNDLAPFPWQRALFAQWHRQWRDGKLGHALLLNGPIGVGKRQLARAMAAAGLCQRPTPVACGTCDACSKVIGGIHPDFLWMERETDDKTGKLRRDIRIEQIRELIDTLALSSHYQAGRFAVIAPVDALGTAGRNALLKTLEEPPAGTFLILVSERPQALPATIRSRCQSWACQPPRPEEVADWAREQQIDLRTLSLAGGAPLLAKAWQDTQMMARFERWANGWRAVGNGRMDPLSFAAEVSKDDAAEFIQWVLRWSHQVMRDALTDAQPWPASALLSAQAEALAAPVLLARNVAPQLVVESLIIAWWRDVRRAAAQVQSATRRRPGETA